METQIINKKKNKRSSNRMVEYNLLTASYDKHSRKKYLNISVDSNNHAWMAEWLMQLADSESSFGTQGFDSPSRRENSSKMINQNIVRIVA